MTDLVPRATARLASFSRGRSRARKSSFVLCFSVILSLTTPATADSQEFPAGEPITPIPQHIDLEPAKVKLGKLLFSDSRLSGGNGLSCASCHALHYGFSDGLAISRGLPGAPGVTNTPTLFNVGFNALLNWAGQMKTLDYQADGVVERASTMGAKWPEVIQALKNDRALITSFSDAYSDGLKRENVIDALVQYERSLITPDAPFDKYLRGNEGAISPEAKEGYRLFKDYGCISCHQGVNVGGNMLQVFGIFGTPDAALHGSTTQGSAQGSGISDKQPVFRVPSLRNVAETAPYFHDGSAKTLREAIDTMAVFQLGRSLTTSESTRIEAFLRSLTGNYQNVPVGDLGK